jgi:exodeoxyribonuclease VII large subunit
MSSDSRQAALDFTRDIFTVSRLNREARAVLEGSFPLLWVEGEISNLAQPASGHLYFSLKDPAAQVRCAMFRAKRMLLRFAPVNGHHVLVRARVSLFEGRGEFQLNVEHMEPAGEGALRLELERLKQKLATAGLFDQALKRPLPVFPRQVGLVTSPTGAAIRDLLSVLRRRFPLLPVVVYPAQVQGQGAVEELIAMLDLANRRRECDVLVVARGGGSLEDLMAFNDERLARAIRASAIPVVTGVGHEIDLTIADLAADQRGATPSAAAEIISPSAAHIGQHLRALEQRLGAAQTRVVHLSRHRLQAAVRHLRLLHPAAVVERQQQGLDHRERRLVEAIGRRTAAQRARWQSFAARLATVTPQRSLERLCLLSAGLEQRLRRAMPGLLQARRERFARAVDALGALSPLATLARGYAVVRLLPDGRVLTDARDAEPGSSVEAELAKGKLRCRVDDRIIPG